MQTKELQLGDLIIYCDSCGVPEHVAVYIGHIDGKAYVTHSVFDKTLDNSGIKTTILKPLFEIDEELENNMHVFRSTNPELAKRAAQRIQQWAKYQVPYDMQRVDLSTDLEDAITYRGSKEKQNPNEFLLDYLRTSAQNKFYACIKYAIRRDECPVRIKNDTSTGRGFFCVQAAILAFQVEELAPYVKTLDDIKSIEGADIWVSDKHCARQILDEYDLPISYLRYQSSLTSKYEFAGVVQSQKTIAVENSHYRPSLVGWDYSKEPNIDDFVARFDSCLALPAKATSINALYQYLLSASQHWKKCGKIDIKCLPTKFTTDEKRVHRAKSMESDELVRGFRLRAASSVSFMPIKANVEIQRSQSDLGQPRTISPTLMKYFS